MAQWARAERHNVSFLRAVFARVTLPEVRGGERCSRHYTPGVLRVADTASVTVVRDAALAVRTFDLRRGTVSRSNSAMI